MKKVVIILGIITILLIPITHKACGAVAGNALPKPHAVGKGNMYYLSFDESVRYVKNFDNHSGGANWFGINLGQLLNNLSGAKTLKYRAQMAVANGFGVCWRLGSCAKGDKYWYCNDCWPNPQAACHKPSIRFPKNGVSVVWDSTVPHYSELGNIATAFYGGWSCDYAGTNYAAKWAGIGKGHK
ncbi:hypothetical protein [Leuconostoc pseudomesenteroides]|uniref:hypothetical protein n=1 Tax=Leuconostoc pseudomesenteroides TaxID=33968 RepID=UPI00166EE23A|nr:hypothetical protein [Leuconostoc pseudomesenteroides]WAM38733.1 hypothetical protein OYT93_00715 [Leuconostoc pseudomesenteroides]